MDISDNQLVAAVRDGEKDCFAALVERYESVIYNLMVRYSDSPEDAADMTRDAFCRAYEKLSGYRQQTSFFAWLYTLSLNYARDWKKRQRYRKFRLFQYAEEVRTEQFTRKEHLEKRQESEQVWKALDRLPEKKREMVILRYRYERSIKELAEIFSISESAVKMRIQRTLKELHGYLASDGFEV